MKVSDAMTAAIGRDRDARRPGSGVRSDGYGVEREVREDVDQRAMLIEPGAVEVEVEAGETTLRGRLDQRRDAEILAKLVARVPGVVTVDSELTWFRDE